MRFDKNAEMTIMKEEMIKTIEIYDNAVKFLITCTLTVISLGITFDSSFLMILTYPIIFLLGKKVFFWRDSLAKKGAYCSVFLEGDDSGYHWETINSFVPSNEKVKKNRTIDFTKDLEINFLLLLNTAIIVVKNFFVNGVNVNTANYITIAVAVLLFITIGAYFLKRDSVQKVRGQWMEAFEKMKKEFDDREGKQVEIH